VLNCRMVAVTDADPVWSLSAGVESMGSPDDLFKIVRQQVEMPRGSSGTPPSKIFEREIP
jgi:hypothetical protein